MFAVRRWIASAYGARAGRAWQAAASARSARSAQAAARPGFAVVRLRRWSATGPAGDRSGR
ncbi:hypothetical protein GCM10010129_28940 [Streptomyces fumigatiscleroticus]|nr:hypothetical protein GCM10010129_28940 [Streptomyces fumigatiscleroticus]